MWAQIGAGRSLGEEIRTCFGADFISRRADKIDGAGELLAIDNDADQVTVEQLPNRSAGKRFGSDVSDARAGGDAGESAISQHRDVLAEREISQCAGHLV